MTAHAGRLALLAVDLAHLPEAPLAAAIRRWASIKPYLPKASELIEMCREAAQSKAQSRRSETWVADRVEEANRKLHDQGRHDIRWEADPLGGGMTIVQTARAKHNPPLTDAEVRALPKHLWSLGLACGELTWDRLRALDLVQDHRTGRISAACGTA